jgi:hypothetical protein
MSDITFKDLDPEKIHDWAEAAENLLAAISQAIVGAEGMPEVTELEEQLEAARLGDPSDEGFNTDKVNVAKVQAAYLATRLHGINDVIGMLWDFKVSPEVERFVDEAEIAEEITGQLMNLTLPAED